MKYKHIAIEGNIGVGKTTLAKLLAKKNKSDLILEKFRKNHFLPLFYHDMEKYGLHVELSFLIDRLEDLSEFKEKKEIISDYFFSKTLLFSKINLDKNAFRIFERVYYQFEKNAAKPDLIIYLYREIPELLKNIEVRGRKNEVQITAEYLKGIHKSYESHFLNSKKYRVLKLDIGDIDFTKKNGQLENVIELISANYKFGMTKIKL